MAHDTGLSLAVGCRLRGRHGRLREAPLADATVVLLDIDVVARTGEDGTFTFAELPAGVYDLSVRGG